MKEITKSVGWAVVRVRNWGPGIGQWDMQIMTPASDDEPAMSVEVAGQENIRVLRDALTEALDGVSP